MAWLTLMRELAPQSKDGEFARPSYAFAASIGDPGFPVESGRYHLYVGNVSPCLATECVHCSGRGMPGALWTCTPLWLQGRVWGCVGSS